MRHTLLHRLRLFAPLVFYVLLVLFLALYLRSIDWSKLHGLQFNWWYVAAASAVALVGRYWQIFIWFVLLQSLGAQRLARHARQLVYVYAKSWLGRYIPGTAPWILGKIYFASRHGIPREKLGVSSLLEAALQIVVMLVLSFAMLLFDSRFDVIGSQTRLFMGLAIVLCLVALIPAVFNRLVSLAYRLLSKKRLADEHLATNGTIAKGASLYVVAALLNGVSFFFITKSLYPSLPLHDLMFVISANNLAGALGMLAIFVPSGLGVREGVQLVLLSTIMPKEISLIVVVVSRVWSVAVDFVFFGLSRTLLGGDLPLPETAPPKISDT